MRSSPAAPPLQSTHDPSRGDPDGDATAATLAAWARLHWPGGEVIASNRIERLKEPVHAGSLIKLAVARAALTQGIVTHDTRFVCRRRVNVAGRRVDCVHPDLGRPLTLDEAIAHSCNDFFVRIAERIDRAGLASMLRELSGGAISVPGGAPLPLVVLGLDGPQTGMLTWARVALASLTLDGEPSEALVRRGAWRAVFEGTASALGEETMLTLAKTGTTMVSDAVQDGRVVAWRPEIGEALIVRAPGVPGRDAARIARAIWDADRVKSEPSVRVGRERDRVNGQTQPVVEAIPLEAYVAGVVAAEGETGMPPAALEALAIAVRSYAQASRGRHQRDGYELCDTTHCQVFGTPTAWSRDAAERTRGVVGTLDAAVVAVPYSASCSGVLASPRDIWGGDAAVVTRTGRDPADHVVDRWQKDVGANELLAVLREAGHRGDVLRDIRVSARTSNGMPSRVALEGLVPAETDATVFRHVIGRRLGWDVLKSHSWDVERTARGYRFTGRGKGHGAGLCLRGASALAAAGSTTAQVLATYVPKAGLQASQDRITLRVPAALTSSAAQIRMALLDTLARQRLQLAVTAPRQLEVIVHPTREAYQRATGRAWWTSASTRQIAGTGYRIDVAPAGSPSELSATLRHETVHVLTAPALALAPAWASEGLAHLVSSPEANRSSPEANRSSAGQPACPSDESVTRPGSLPTMRDAYARAATCVAAALPNGPATWRTLIIPATP